MNSKLNDYAAMKNYNNSVQELNHKAELRRVTKGYAHRTGVSKQQVFITFMTISIVLVVLIGLFV